MSRTPVDRRFAGGPLRSPRALGRITDFDRIRSRVEVMRRSPELYRRPRGARRPAQRLTLGGPHGHRAGVVKLGGMQGRMAQEPRPVWCRTISSQLRGGAPPDS